ncbi:Transposon Tf2-9 polyprotein [Dictyocoela muelleri]|nr:Transposon Tf2-9 polyprotein [Dictyocoela muelleri]
MEHVKGKAKYPESQGQIERFNGTLKKDLQNVFMVRKKRWIEVLRDIFYQYNNSQHSAPLKTPFEVFRQLKIENDRVKISQTPASAVKTQYEKYTSSLYKEKDIPDLFKENDKVIIKKDFDNNKKTKKNLFDSDFYEEVYFVIQSFNNLLLLENEKGKRIWVNSKRVKILK